MGSGSWSESNYCSYSTSVGRSFDASSRTISTTYASAAQAYTQSTLSKDLDPKGVIRECCETAEHPNTLPVILALDVTGSMGKTAIQVQKQLNPIMVDLYKNVKDVEIAVMGIGDLAYDNMPIQFSQFESDIRIAENLDKICFEGGGGGNSYESYTAAWYMGARRSRLDCWKRGKKGVIITMGDECLNPYLPKSDLANNTGDSANLQDDVDTEDLYEEASKKYEIYHICVKSKSYPNQDEQAESFKKVLGNQHVFICGPDEIHQVIMDIVKRSAENGQFIESPAVAPSPIGSGEISW